MILKLKMKKKNELNIKEDVEDLWKATSHLSKKVDKYIKRVKNGRKKATNLRR